MVVCVCVCAYVCFDCLCVCGRDALVCTCVCGVFGCGLCVYVIA